MTMTRKAFLRDFWRYYIHLEKRFAGSLDYVELDECNYGTFSNYYASLLQSIGAEIDHFMKVYCGYPVSERHIIDDYASSILPDEEFNITEQKVLGVGTDIVISPFKDWNSKCAAKSLFWWDAYNNVKHNRSENFKKANLENVLYSLAALYILEMNQLKRIANEDPNALDIPSPESDYFQLQGRDCFILSALKCVVTVDGQTYEAVAK